MENHAVPFNLTVLTVSGDEPAQTEWARYGLPILIGLCVLMMFALVQLAVFVLPESDIWKKALGYRNVTSAQDNSLLLADEKNKLETRLKGYREKSKEYGGGGSGGAVDDIPVSSGLPSPLPLVVKLVTPRDEIRVPEEHIQMKPTAVRQMSTIEDVDPCAVSDLENPNPEGIFEDVAERYYGFDNVGFNHAEVIYQGGKPNCHYPESVRVYPVAQSADSEDECQGADHVRQVCVEVHSNALDSPAEHFRRSSVDTGYEKYYQLLFQDDQDKTGPVYPSDVSLQTPCIGYQNKDPGGYATGSRSDSMDALHNPSKDRHVSYSNPVF